MEVDNEAAASFLSLLLQGSGSQVQYPADVVMSLSEIDTQKQTSFFSLNQPQPAAHSHPGEVGALVPEIALSHPNHQLKVVAFPTLNTKELARSQSSQPSVCKKASSQNKQRSQPLNAKSTSAKSAKVSKTKRGAKKRENECRKGLSPLSAEAAEPVLLLLVPVLC